MNSVGKLQEYFQSFKMTLPKYTDAKIIARNPELNQIIYSITVVIFDKNNQTLQFTGTGNSKSAAKQNAAEEACNFILPASVNNMVLDLSNETRRTNNDTNHNISMSNVDEFASVSRPTIIAKQTNPVNPTIPINTTCTPYTSNISNTNVSNIMTPYSPFNNCNNYKQYSTVNIMVDLDNIDLPEKLVNEFNYCMFYIFRSRNSTKNIKIFENRSNCVILLAALVGKDVTDHCITWHTSRLFYENGANMNNRENIKFIIVTGDSFGQTTAAFCGGVLACNIQELSVYLNTFDKTRLNINLTN